MTIAEGDMLPDLVLTDANGQPASLRGLGRPLIVYFYPRADTPGCTSEAQDFSAHAEAIRAQGGDVVGISKDAPAKLARFSDKYALRVRLLSDPDGLACEAFGTWIEKSLYGRRYMGIDRATFLFDATGKLARSWRKVKVNGHAEQVLGAMSGARGT